MNSTMWPRLWCDTWLRSTLALVAHRADVAAVGVLVRDVRRDHEAHPGARFGRQADGNRARVLEGQPEVPQPRLKEDGVGVGRHLEFKRRALLVDQPQRFHEGRAGEVGCQARLDVGQALGQPDHEVGVLFRLVDQQAGATVAEWDALQRDAVS
jgi:hypothetical protein